MTRRPSRFAAVMAVFTLACLAPAAVLASQALASDLGCYNCHGNPPRKKAPTFADLARTYAAAANDAAAQRKLADHLRDGAVFSHIDAHERLSPEVAAQLVRWISEGAR